MEVTGLRPGSQRGSRPLAWPAGRVELKLAGGHHASMEAALIMALAFLCVAATASCFWLAQPFLVWESWRDRSGWGRRRTLGATGQPRA